MGLQLMDDEGRQPDGPPAGACLGRAGDQLAFDLGEDLGHGDRPGRQIDPALAEPGQLADPQVAVGAHEHWRPVAGMDGLGQVDDLGGGEKAHLLCSILGSGTLRQGLCVRISGRDDPAAASTGNTSRNGSPSLGRRRHSAEHAIGFPGC
jgi:hypothetical protein